MATKKQMIDLMETRLAEAKAKLAAIENDPEDSARRKAALDEADRAERALEQAREHRFQEELRVARVAGLVPDEEARTVGSLGSWVNISGNIYLWDGSPAIQAILAHLGIPKASPQQARDIDRRPGSLFIESILHSFLAACLERDKEYLKAKAAESDATATRTLARAAERRAVEARDRAQTSINRLERELRDLRNEVAAAEAEKRTPKAVPGPGELAAEEARKATREKAKALLAMFEKGQVPAFLAVLEQKKLAGGDK